MKARKYLHQLLLVSALLGFLLCSASASAQWYGRLGGGYAGQAGKDQITGFSPAPFSGFFGQIIEGFQELNMNILNVDLRLKTGSYGQGFNLHAGVGYMFGKHVGAEVEFGYAVSDRIKSNSTTVINNQIQFVLNPELRSKTVFFTPSLVLSAGTGKINPYGRIGLLLGLPSIENSDLALLGLTKVDYKGRYYGGLMTGFSGALGLSADLSRHIALYGEVRMTAASYRPTKGKIEVLKLNNVSEILEGKELELRERITAQDKSVQVQQTFSNPFGSVGFNTGVLFKF